MLLERGKCPVGVDCRTHPLAEVGFESRKLQNLLSQDGIDRAGEVVCLHSCIFGHAQLSRQIGLHTAVANFRMQKSQRCSILSPPALLRGQALMSSRLESNKLSPFVDASASPSH
jgi:hypothetical protein